MEHVFCILPHSQEECLMKIKNVKWHFQIFLVLLFQQEYSHHKQNLVITTYKNLCSSHYFLASLHSSQILNFFQFLTVSQNLSLELIMGNLPDHLPLSMIDLEILWLMNTLDKSPGLFGLGQSIRMGLRISFYHWLTTYISRKGKNNNFYCARSFKNNYKNIYLLFKQQRVIEVL